MVWQTGWVQFGSVWRVLSSVAQCDHCAQSSVVQCGPVWCGPVWFSVVQCGGCGKYSHKLFLNPRLPAATQQSACRELPPDTQVDSQGVDSGQWTVKGGVDKQVEIQGVDIVHWTSKWTV